MQRRTEVLWGPAAEEEPHRVLRIAGPATARGLAAARVTGPTAPARRLEAEGKVAHSTTPDTGRAYAARFAQRLVLPTVARSGAR